MVRRTRLLCAVALAASGCMSPLMDAAKRGDAREVRSLLDRGADPNAEKNILVHGQMTPLLLAALHGRLDAASALLDGGADVNQRCPHMPMTTGCESAVGCAVAGGHQDMLDLVLRRGAVVTLKDAQSARRRGFASMVPALEKALEAQKAQASARPPAGEASAGAGIRSDVDYPQRRLKERPHAFAVIVSVENYAKLPAAQFAERDGQAVRRHLIALGYPEKNVILLSGPQATFSGLQSYLEEWLPRNAGPDSTVFFYYSGHGAPDTGSGAPYLLPWDGDPAFLESSAFSLKRLYASLAKLKAREVVVALDACFSGAGGRSVLPKGARPLVTKLEEGIVPDASLTVFAAAGGAQITGTLDDQGHGTFTYHFLKGLGGAAKDARGRVTAQGLYEYLKPRVEEDGRRQNRAQTPTVSGTAGERVLASFE
ncbi:MAG: ankyrin repeat domain-containing protein [Elusimicrobia bacterium]|nr:ankyrin repeat domain-containing protein [Elusimicrobiota bacterium]